VKSALLALEISSMLRTAGRQLVEMTPKRSMQRLPTVGVFLARRCVMSFSWAAFAQYTDLNRFVFAKFAQLKDARVFLDRGCAQPRRMPPSFFMDGFVRKVAAMN